MTTVYFVLAGIALAALLVWLLMRSQRKLGRSEASADAASEAVENAIEGNKIDEAVDHLSESELFDELYNNDRK